MAWWHEQRRRWLPYEEWIAKKRVEEAEQASAKEIAFKKIYANQKIKGFLKTWKNRKKIVTAGGRKLPLHMLKEIRLRTKPMLKSCKLPRYATGDVVQFVKSNYRGRLSKVPKFALRSVKSSEWVRKRPERVAKFKSRLKLAESSKRTRARSRAVGLEGSRQRAADYLAKVKLAKADAKGKAAFAYLSDIGKRAKLTTEDLEKNMWDRRQAEYARQNYTRDYVKQRDPVERVIAGIEREEMDIADAEHKVREAKRKYESDVEDLINLEFVHDGDEMSHLLSKRSRHADEIPFSQDFSPGAIAVKNKISRSKQAAEARLAVSLDKKRRAEKLKASREAYAVERLMAPIEAASARKRKLDEVVASSRARKAARVEAEAIEAIMAPLEAQNQLDLEAEIEDAYEEQL